MVNDRMVLIDVMIIYRFVRKLSGHRFADAGGYNRGGRSCSAYRIGPRGGHLIPQH